MRKYFKKLNFIYCLIILLTLLSNPAIAQETEVSEFETGKVYSLLVKEELKAMVWVFLLNIQKATLW